jgi:hypothetical protein
MERPKKSRPAFRRLEDLAAAATRNKYTAEEARVDYKGANSQAHCTYRRQISKLILTLSGPRWTNLDTFESEFIRFPKKLESLLHILLLSKSESYPATPGHYVVRLHSFF